MLPWLTWQRKWMCLCAAHGFAWPPAKCLPQTGQHFSSLFARQQQKQHQVKSRKNNRKTSTGNKLWIKSSQTNTFWRAWAALQFVSFQLPNQKWTWWQRLGNEAKRSRQKLPIWRVYFTVLCPYNFFCISQYLTVFTQTFLIALNLVA